MKIKLKIYGRFGNILLDILYCITKYMIYGSNETLTFIFVVDEFIYNFYKYSFDFQILNILSIIFNDKLTFIYQSKLNVDMPADIYFNGIWNENCEDYKNIFLHADNINTIKEKYFNNFIIPNNKIILNMRLNHISNDIEKGYRVFNTEEINEIIKNTNIKDTIYVYSDNIERSKEILFSVKHNFIFQDKLWCHTFLDILNCKTLIAATSTFSILGGILGCCTKMYVSYPYIKNNYELNDIHNFLYSNEKTIKENF